MRHADNENGKQHMTKGMKLTNQKKIRTLGEEEMQIFMGMLEADITKQMVIREKKSKNHILGEPETYTKLN